MFSFTSFTIFAAALPEVSEACMSAIETFEACATEGFSKDIDLFMNYLKALGEAAGCFEAAADEAAIAACAEPLVPILCEACPSGVDPLMAACDETPSAVFGDLALDVFEDIAGNVKDGELLICVCFFVCYLEGIGIPVSAPLSDRHASNRILLPSTSLHDRVFLLFDFSHQLPLLGRRILMCMLMRTASVAVDEEITGCNMRMSMMGNRRRYYYYRVRTLTFWLLSHIHFQCFHCHYSV